MQSAAAPSSAIFQRGEDFFREGFVDRRGVFVIEPDQVLGMAMLGQADHADLGDAGAIGGFDEAVGVDARSP